MYSTITNSETNSAGRARCAVSTRTPWLAVARKLALGLAIIGAANVPNQMYGQPMWVPNNTGGLSYIPTAPGNNVGIGNLSPFADFEVANSDTVVTRGILSSQYSVDKQGAALNVQKSRAPLSGGTGAAATVLNGDNIGAFNAWAYDGSTFALSARMRFVVDGAVATGNVPSAIQFLVGPGAANESLRIASNGNVGIGTASPLYKLSVNGIVQASELIVNYATIPDYVFDPGYKLMPLRDVAAFVAEHHHLPEIPSAAEVAKNGIGVGDMQSKLLAKIEEITLHMIQAEEKNNHLESQLRDLQAQVARNK